MAQTETEIVQGIGSDYAIKYGFSVDRGLLLQVAAAASRTSSSTRSRRTRTSPTGCASSGTRASTTSIARPMPEWGGNLGEIDFDNIFYYIKPTENQAELVGGPAGRHQGHLGQARASPRPRRSTSPASARSTSRRSSTTSSRRTSTKQGVIFLDTDTALREHEELVQAVLRDDHPAERQQVRGAQLGRVVGRLVHLRAAGRARSRCRCRRTSASTPRTWASSSAR